MAAQDHAILVAISWYPASDFTPLEGPLNDVRIFEEWLTDPQRGGVPPANVQRVVTPEPRPDLRDPDEARPGGDCFDKIFKKLLRERHALGPDRVTGRLYLYFSGHGFSSRTQDKDAEAALYCANATRVMYEHIFGTHYARIAKAWALFSEIVLVMDCCRDAESVRTPMPRPYRDTPDDQFAGDVALLSIYAVPKGGAAQERYIPERKAVHGLLTHALVKLLDEIPPSSERGISGSELRQHMLDRWKAICGDDAARRPEIYLPPSGEIYFKSGSRVAAGRVNFTWQDPQAEGAELTLVDARLAPFARFDLNSKQAAPAPPGSPIISHAFTESGLTLELAPSFYGYQLSGAISKQGAFRTDGGAQNVAL